MNTLHGEAYIAINHNRLKTYNGLNVYLQPKQEFEIELYNPSLTTKKATIYINGKLLSSSSLIVKPGQRIYLERYLDSPKKFLFDTYIVDGSPQTLAAIASNGDIEIRFYDEQTPYIPISTIYSYPVSSYYNSSFTGGQQVNSISRTSYRGSNMMGAGGQSAVSTDSIETGRVEAGDHSNQKFKNYIGEFNSYHTNIVNIKLLPISAQPIQAKDLATYCTNCGTRNKKNNYKYCPKCGIKF